MRLVFLLSGEHDTLPRAEVISSLRALNVNYREEPTTDAILIIDADLPSVTLDALSKRLGMTHGIYELIGISKAGEREVLALIRDIDIAEFMAEEQTFAVRVRGKKPYPLERGLEGRVGEVIRRSGYEVNLTHPAKTFTLLFRNQKCYFGLLLRSRLKDEFELRRPHLRPFFSPGVIMPKFARAIVNLSGVRENELLLDPFCGTGGILIEAGMIGARLIGIDVQRKMVRGTAENLKFYRLKADLIVGDASKIALRTESVDAIVTDLPYGRSSLVSGSFSTGSSAFARGRLNPSYALSEIYRVLRYQGKAVIVFNSPDIQSLFRDFRIIAKHEYRVHKSLNRYITVLEKKKKNSFV
ncbi:MAG: methyltransferase domain-containing protein [Halobacteriota archaeon]